MTSPILVTVPSPRPFDWAAPLFAIVLALSACSAPPTPASKSAPVVSVLTLQPETLALETELAGRTVASEESEVRPQVEGVLLKRLFTEGETVKAGQPLFQIEPTLYQAASNEARANLATAEAALASARLQAQRYQVLGKSQLIAQQEVDDADAAYKQAAANAEASRAALDTARTTRIACWVNSASSMVSSGVRSV